MIPLLLAKHHVTLCCVYVPIIINYLLVMQGHRQRRTYNMQICSVRGGHIKGKKQPPQRDLSLTVKSVTFDHHYMGSNPVGLS